MATKTSNTGRDSDKFTLRFSEGLREQIKRAAAANNRTMNAEIVARLQSTFKSRQIAANVMAASHVKPAYDLPDYMKEVAKEQVDKLNKAFDENFLPALAALIDEQIQKEHEKRVRLLEEVMETHLFRASKTKKPKA
ncbi:MAG: Arc family DNA-binding protein [Burkholderiaceae bacterium]|nr:Arc family DNA-binding protein [Burkholderiaceae bacterium]